MAHQTVMRVMKTAKGKCEKVNELWLVCLKQARSVRVPIIRNILSQKVTDFGEKLSDCWMTDSMALFIETLVEVSKIWMACQLEHCGPDIYRSENIFSTDEMELYFR
jgi:hypothetical protein